MPEKKSSKFYFQLWVQIALLVGFCFFLYFFNLGQWDLWDPDEPRYAQVAKEMVARGDWILMHLNEKIYSHKPPLFFWLLGLSSYLWQGFSSFSVRFIPALFGTLTVLVTFLLGKELYSSRTGFLSGLILATSFQFAYLSIRANIDTTLTFFTTASLLCFFRWYRTIPLLRKEEREGPRENQMAKENGRRITIYGFYISMGLATLTKGPVGFIIPALVSFFYLTMQRDLRTIRKMKVIPGLLLVLGVVLAWYIPAVARGGEDYLNSTLFRHTTSRYLEGWAKLRPIYYYLYEFPLGFFPWIFFFPAALMYGYSRGMNEKRKEFFFLTVWFALIFLFFSFSKGKRSLYLLPLYPAAAVMVGNLWNSMMCTSRDYFNRRWISFPLYGLVIPPLFAGAALPWITSMKFPPWKFPSMLPYHLPFAFFFIVSSLAIFVLYRFKKYGAILCLIIGIMATVFFYTQRVVFPLMNADKSARFISEEVTSRILSGEKLCVYGRVPADAYNFYTGIIPILELHTQEELLHLLESSNRVFCIIPLNDYFELQKMKHPPEVQFITRHKTKGVELVLTSNL